MLGFSPFKKRPNKFNYIPRYYDPEKEAREERRAELRGERADDALREYKPGQYIRRRSEARGARRANERERDSMRIWKMAAGAVIVMLFVYLLAPKLVDLFLSAKMQSAPVATEVQQPAAKRERVDEFDLSGISDEEWPETVLTVVPNDYQETKEE